MANSSTFSTVPLTDKNIDINVLICKIYHIIIKNIYRIFNDKLEHELH